MPTRESHVASGGELINCSGPRRRTRPLAPAATMERTNSDVEHAIGSILGLNAKDWCYSCQARPGKDKLRQCAGCK